MKDNTAKSEKRHILHVDMDAFYASVEQVDQPDLQGKPVIIGKGKRGVVSAASYEARKFGVHSAMPIFEARRLCPKGVFLPVRMSRYREVSRMIMAILGSYTPLMEKASVDEAFLDVTGTERLFGTPVQVAESIKSRIRKETGLTCSIGVAPNKFLAKIASDLEKPDGLTVIPHEKVKDFLRYLPVQKIPGVGSRTLDLLKGLGVVYAADILRIPEDFLIRKLGKAGYELIDRARGMDDSPVIPASEPKSFSAEHTLSDDTCDQVDVRHKVRLIGVGVSNLSRGIRQLSMLDRRRQKKEMALDNAVDRLRQRYGTSILVRGSIMEKLSKPGESDGKSQE